MSKRVKKDDLINYETGGQHRYAYFKSNMLPVFEDSIMKDILVDLLIVRVPIGKKLKDFVAEVKVSTTVKPTSTSN